MAKVEIIISNTAINDLAEIEEYISRDSYRMAHKLISKILSRINLLSDFPGMGRIVPEFNDSKIKELILGNYRVVYMKIDESKIVVLRIIHGARLLELGE
ncbi:MAG: type II toxin-antitoxin system RelE/ParE family toxin [Chitinophagales bacterium]